MRTKKEIQELIQNVKIWYSEDIGVSFDIKNVLPVLEKMRDQRILDFLKRRIGHLKDTDFSSFIEELSLEKNKSVRTKKV